MLHVYELDPLPIIEETKATQDEKAEKLPPKEALAEETNSKEVEKAEIMPPNEPSPDNKDENTNETAEVEETNSSDADDDDSSGSEEEDDDDDDDDGDVPTTASSENNEADDENDDEEVNDNDDDNNDKATMAKRCSFLAIAQRRSEVYAREVLHPLTHYVFGIPLLLRVVDMDNLTNSQVYDMVAARLKNFVPSSVLKFLDPSSEADDNDKETKDPSPDEERSKSEIRQHLTKTYTDMESVAAGHVPRYGFRLRLASRDGRRCSLCPWYDCCIGCLVPDDNSPTVIMCGDSMVIDWHFAVDLATNGFGSRSAQVDHSLSQHSPFRARIPPLPVKNHRSCGMGSKGQGYHGSISLEDCLDAFAKEEKIPEVSVDFLLSPFHRSVSHLTVFLILVGLLLQMQRVSSANEDDEPLAASSCCHHSTEEIPVYSNHATKIARLRSFSYRRIGSVPNHGS